MTTPEEQLAVLDEVEQTLVQALAESEPTGWEGVRIVAASLLGFAGAVLLGVGATAEPTPISDPRGFMISIGLAMVAVGTWLIRPVCRRTWQCCRTIMRLIGQHRRLRSALPAAVGGPAARRWWWLRVWGPAQFAGFLFWLLILCFYAATS